MESAAPSWLQKRMNFAVGSQENDPSVYTTDATSLGPIDQEGRDPRPDHHTPICPVIAEAMSSLPFHSSDSLNTDVEPPRFHVSSHPTTHVCFSKMSTVQLNVLLANTQGAIVQRSKKRIYVSFRSAQDASAAVSRIPLVPVRPAAHGGLGLHCEFVTPVMSPTEIAVTRLPAILREANLRLVLDFCSPEEEVRLLQQVDVMPWDNSISRATQHYGRRFDYRTKSVAESEALPDTCIPSFFDEPFRRLQESNVLPWNGEAANQVTVNEYLPGMGIARHVDTHSAFEDGIAALSLGAGIAMRMQLDREPWHSVVIWLPPRSLLAFVGASRYEWSHAIPMRKTDTLEDGSVQPRGRRVSVTIRRVLHSSTCSCSYPWACDTQGGAPIVTPRIAQLSSPDVDSTESAS
eukprot:6188372-Pleurochrysis_carterae.AAC.3